MKETHPTREMLAAFDLGLLPVVDRSAVEQHVWGCDACCRTLESIADDALVALIKSSAATPAASPSTAYGGSAKSDTPPGKRDASPSVPAPLIDHPRYRIVSLLGAGGMGAVFHAEHRMMERPVALKILNQEMVQRPGAVQRFRQEIKAASLLSHPNIVTAYDADQAGDVHFLVMELVQGNSLDRQLKRGQMLDAGAVCSWICQAACGLQHAYERGMIHRDIKPANLMLSFVPGQSPPGTAGNPASRPRGPMTSDNAPIIKILDFGLARFASEYGGTMLTASGSLVGTPDYVAPEQARDPRRADIRADIYSLGCTLYHLLAGQVPHPGSSALQKLIAHQELSPRPLTDFRPDLPPALLAVIARMMAKDPNERYQTPAEVVAALSPFAGKPGTAPTGQNRITASSRSRLIVLFAMIWLLGIALMLVAGFLYWRNESAQPVSTSGAEPTTPVVAQPTQATTPVIAPPTRPEVRLVIPDNKPAQDAALAWLRDNHRFGPANNFPTAMAQKLDTELGTRSGVMMLLSGGLLSSNRPTLLAIRDGQFHVFDLLPDEAAPLGATRTRTVSMVSQRDPHRLPESVRISGLTLSPTGLVPAGTPVRGSVRYQILGDPHELYSLRVTAYYGTVRRTITRFLEAPNAPPGVCTFSILTDPKGGVISGPLLIYVDVGLDVQMKDGKFAGMTVVSNTLATLAHVEAVEKPVPEK